MSQKPNKKFMSKLSLIAGSLLTLSAISVSLQPAYGEPEASCKEHEIENGKCFICNPALREKGRLWCQEHSRYEDRCWICHPELKDENRLFCVEHSLYEDECFFCHPEVAQSVEDAGAPPSDDHAHGGLFCNEHQVPEAECGICQPQLASSLEPGQNLKIRFASKDSASKAGISTERPVEGVSMPVIEAFGEVNYNGNSLARITPLASGVIQKVKVDVGDFVQSGDVMVVINSPEIAEAKASFLSALADVRVKEKASLREEKLVKEKISAARDYQEAKASYEIALLSKSTARQKLLNYGFTTGDIAEIEKDSDSSSSYVVKAPFSGTLVNREAVVGELVDRGGMLFTVADLQNMWLDLSIPAHESAYVEKGMRVEAGFDSLRGQKVEGEIIWVATSIDDRSRMLKARALIPNEDGKIKSGMFGKVKVNGERSSKSHRISKDSIQRLEDIPFVFVKDEDDLYSLRRIELGNMNGTSAEVLAGIDDEDRVVTEGSFIVFSEFLKSRLGAGCADD